MASYLAAGQKRDAPNITNYLAWFWSAVLNTKGIKDICSFRGSLQVQATGAFFCWTPALAAAFFNDSTDDPRSDGW